jgi:hypothetical protein
VTSDADAAQVTPLSDAKRALLQRWRQGNVDLRRQDIVPTPFTTLAPTSIQQEIVARRHAESPGSSAFTIAHAAYVGTAVDRDMMIDAFARLAERHETLRTTFEVGDDQVRQRIGDRATFEFEAIDLTSLTHGTSLDAAIEVCHDLALQPMDIVKGPLGRVALVRVGPESSVLFLAVDHLIGDGFSLGISLLEASELYEAVRAGRSASLPRLEVQYRDYAAWQRRWLASEAWRPQVEYWRRQLHGIPPAQLVGDRRDGDLAASRAASEWFRFTPDLSSRVRDVARAEGVTPFHVLFCAYCLLHRLLCDQEQLGIGTAFHNRLYPEVEPLIGYFANTVVLRVDMTGRPTGRDLLQRLKETATAAWTRQEVVLAQYLAEVEPGRDLRADPLYRTFFVLQPPLPAQTFAGGDLSPVNVETGVASFDLALYMWDEPTYRGKLEWADELFEARTGERLRAAYFRILDALLCRCAAPIDDLIAACQR